jgi:hypothetical protein
MIVRCGIADARITQPKPGTLVRQDPMRWFDEWRALSARMDGLLRAATFFTGTLENVGRHDHVGVIGKSLLPELEAVTRALETFRREHAAELPAEGRLALDDFLKTDWRAGLNIGQLQALAPMVVCRSRFEYAIRSSESNAISLVELSFQHLRRSILVDEQVRARWQTAFTRGEPACERLGAVHLLGHGVWAFKVSGERAATDLVLAEPLERLKADVERVARTVVLTEWKLVRDDDAVEQAALEARRQATTYASGVLGGLELRGTRYIVLVSHSEVQPPADHLEADIVYRHIALPVEPATPSKAAQRTKAG